MSGVSSVRNRCVIRLFQHRWTCHFLFMRRKMFLLFLTAWFAAALSCPAASDSILARVALLSDPHLSTSTNETGLRHMRNFDRAIAAVNAAAPDFVLIAGDLTEDGTAEQFACYKQRAAQFMGPVIVVPGNRDVGHPGNDNRKRTVTPERVKSFGDVGPNWFTTNLAGIRVVGLNACLFGTGLPEERQQWRFLKNELSTKPAPPTLLLQHFPLFTLSADEPANGWNVPPAPRQMLLNLATTAGVRAVLSGHLHYPIVHRTNGILFLSNPATSFGLPPILQPAGWTLLSFTAQGEIRPEFQPLH